MVHQQELILSTALGIEDSLLSSQVQAASTTSSAPSASSALGCEMHVYEEGGWNSFDRNIMGADKATLLYHLSIPSTWTGTWRFSLKKGGKEGREVARIEKALLVEKSFSVVLVEPGRTIPCTRDKHSSLIQYNLSSSYGTDTYRWVQDSSFTHSDDFSLYRTSDLDTKPKELCTPLARWKTPSWARKKYGSLLVQPGYEVETELILASALGINASESDTVLSQTFSLPPYEHASSSTSQTPIQYNLYRDGRVTGEGKDVLFILKAGGNRSGMRDFKILRGGEEGEEVFSLLKRQAAASFEVVYPDGRKVQCLYSGTDVAKYEVMGKEVEAYRWLQDGTVKKSSDFSLYRSSELDSKGPSGSRVIASWKSNTLALNKDGVLLIQPQHAYEQELILALALGVQEYVREVSRK
ncbi:hypothetical protein JCM8547_001576 [Rhodosporidiobolus lusitaniae]